MYIIVKTAVFDQGVMWIGRNLDFAKERADFFASNNDDGHHEYEVRKFVEPEARNNYIEGWSDKCELVYTGVRS